MIEKEQLIEIGRLLKPHGLHGEMTASVIDAVFDDVFSRMQNNRKKGDPYFVIEVDGIFVPFYIKDYRFRSENTILISFDDISTQERAAELCGQTLYFDRRCFTKKEAEQYDAVSEEGDGLIGYTIIDTKHGELGKIIDIDDQTANILFFVETTDGELMIPAAEELISAIDDETRTIIMNLPQGLINIDEAEEE